MSGIAPVHPALPLTRTLLYAAISGKPNSNIVYGGKNPGQRAIAEVVDGVRRGLAAGTRCRRLAPADSWAFGSASGRKRRLPRPARVVLLVADDPPRSRPRESHRRNTSCSARAGCSHCPRGNGGVRIRHHLSRPRPGDVVVDAVP